MIWREVFLLRSLSFFTCTSTYFLFIYVQHIHWTMNWTIHSHYLYFFLYVLNTYFLLFSVVTDLRRVLHPAVFVVQVQLWVRHRLPDLHAALPVAACPHRPHGQRLLHASHGHREVSHRTLPFPAPQVRTYARSAYSHTVFASRQYLFCGWHMKTRYTVK